ncbi:MAG: hypothetical protein JXB88_01960 [Spirochaetales bacterium]|nr:hypothetical protein [Spirochaetales bacterium]
MAVPSLFALKERGWLAGVVVPDKTNSIHANIRGVAEDWDIPFIVITEPVEYHTLSGWLNRINAGIAFVMTFPYKLPAEILSIPPAGFLNFHPGLLPKYRGIEPIFWQIYNQEEYGGITVHRMDPGFDSGPVLHMEKVPILPDDTYGLHLNKLSMAAQKAVIAVIDKLESDTGEMIFLPQEKTIVFHATRPAGTELMINWTIQDARQIQALVRAANPAFDGALVNLRGIPFHLLQVSVEENPDTVDKGIQPGTIICADREKGLKVMAMDGNIINIRIIKANEGVFTGDVFAACYCLKENEIFLSPF